MSRRSSRGRTPKKSNQIKEEISLNQRPIELAVVNKEQLTNELSKGLNTENKFANSFKIQKGGVLI